LLHLIGLAADVDVAGRLISGNHANSASIKLWGSLPPKPASYLRSQMPKKVKSATAAKRLAAIDKDVTETLESEARTAAIVAVDDGALFADDRAAAKSGALAKVPGVKYYVRPPKPANLQSEKERRLIAKVAAKLQQSLGSSEAPEAAKPDPWAPPKAAPPPARNMDGSIELPVVVLPDGTTGGVGVKRPRPAAAGDGALSTSGSAAVAKRPRRASAGAAVAAPAPSATAAAAAVGGYSYNPSVGDHEAAVAAAAKSELAAEAAKRPRSELATREQARAAGNDALVLAGAGAAGPLVRPSRAAVRDAKRPLVLPLSGDLTGSLRSMKRVPAAVLARDALVDLVAAGLVSEKRRRGKKASRISKKRSKAIEFPRTPASAFGVIREEEAAAAGSAAGAGGGKAAGPPRGEGGLRLGGSHARKVARSAAARAAAGPGPRDRGASRTAAGRR